MLVIDTHVHVWQPPSARFPWHPIGRLRPDFSWSLDDQVAAMAAAGIDKGVIVQTSWYGFDNSYGSHCLGRYPDKFAYVGMADPRRSDLADELARLAGQGMRGLRIPALLRPDLPWWDAPEAERLWRQAGALGLILCLLVTPQQVVDAASTIERHEEVRVVVDHLAHPDLEEPPGGPLFHELLKMSRLPHLYLKVSAFPAISRLADPYPDVLGWVQEAFAAYGPQRLMWGTDHAMTQRIVEFPLARALQLVDQALAAESPGDRAWVKGRAAAELWQLGEGA